MQDELRCARCGDMERALEVIQGENDKLAAENAGLTLQLKRAAQAEHGIRQQMKRMLDDDTADDETIRSLIEFWKRRLGHPRAKAPKSGKRWKVVKGALRHHTAEELRLAIEGLALVPYVGAGGRRAQGSEDQRYDEVEYAIGDEVRVKQMRRRFELAQDLSVQNASVLWETWQSVAALERVYAALVLSAAVKVEDREVA